MIFRLCVDSQELLRPWRRKYGNSSPASLNLLNVQLDIDQLMPERIERSQAEWKQSLSPEQFQVARCGGTERAFTGAYWNNKKTGLYHCICCDAPLFSSAAKFDSGTGWPSFWDGASPDAITTKEDRSHGMVRVEINCSRCDAHLGHIFSDGPAPTGQRYCVNSASLDFKGS